MNSSVAVRVGGPAPSGEVKLEREQANPPARSIKGSLIEAMSLIHLFVQNHVVWARPKETSGPGTEATRARILKMLKKRGYITVRGRLCTPLMSVVPSSTLGRCISLAFQRWRRWHGLHPGAACRGNGLLSAELAPDDR